MPGTPCLWRRRWLDGGNCEAGLSPATACCTSLWAPTRIMVPEWFAAQVWLGRLAQSTARWRSALDHFTAVCDGLGSCGPSNALVDGLAGGVPGAFEI